jgi:hypothetical protein
MSDSVSRKPADKLAAGDIVAAGELRDVPTKILFAHVYPAPMPGFHVQLMHQPFGTTGKAVVDVVWSSLEFALAAEDDLRDFRERAERAEKIADLRAVADMLERNPDVPLPAYPGELVHLHHEGNVAKVRELAAKFDVKVDEHLDDRTEVTIGVGRFEYRVVAWHEGGRPAEPKPKHFESGGWKGEDPGTCGIECGCGVTYDGFDTLAEAKKQLQWHIEDPSGLSRSRADEDTDPQPAAGRVEPHAGAVVGDGQLVEIAERTLCGAFTPTGDCTMPPGHKDLCDSEYAASEAR